MPSQAANLASFRKGGHKLFAHMSIYKGAVLIEADIIAVGPLPAKYIAVSITSGDWHDIQPGFRIGIFTPGGKWKGDWRVRFGNTITDTVIPVRELSEGVIPAAVGDTLRVYKDPVLDILVPEDDELFSPDGTPIGDYGSAPRPWVNSSGAWAGWTRMLPAVMDGVESFTVDPDSGGDIDHLWDSDGLTISFGSSSTPGIALMGDAGEYLVAHTGTDVDNGKSATQRTPVVIHDKAHPPYRVLIDELPNSEERGGSARVHVLGNALLNDVHDGAFVILWKEEYVAGTRQSFGARAPGRSHVLMVGYLRSEEGEKDGATGVESLTFEVISPLARLDELMGYSKIYLDDASPDDWNKVKALSVWRAIVQTAQYATTLNASGFDLVKTSTFEDAPYSGFELDTSTPLAQMRDLATSTDGRLIEDRRGRFEVQMRPELVALADRASLPVTLRLTPRDIKKWHYSREHWRPTNRIEVHGFVAGATTDDNVPIFSEWPGRGPGMGRETSTIERKIVTGATKDEAQQRLNECAGRLGAAQDGIYVDADGALQMALDLELTLRGVYDVFDLYDELLELDVTANRRGLYFGDAQYVFVSSSVSFADGTAETVARFRTCTNGAKGSAFTPKTEDTAPYTPPGNIPTPTPLPRPRLPAYDGALPTEGFILSAAGPYAARATAFDPVGGTITYVDRSAGLVGDGIWFCSNPFEYKQALALTSYGLEYMSDQSDNSASWAPYKTNLQLWGDSGKRGWIIVATIHRNGCFIAIDTDGDRAVTFNAGATWTLYSDIPLYDVMFAERTAGVVYGVGVDGNLYKSINYGVTFASTPDLAAPWPAGLRRSVYIPYSKSGGAANPDGATLTGYQTFNFNSGGTQTGRISVYPNGWNDPTGFTWPGSSPVEDPALAGLNAQRPCTAFTYDAAYSAYCCANVGGSGRGLHVRQTSDFFVTRAVIYDNNFVEPYTTSIQGFPTNPGVLLWFSKGNGSGGGGLWVMPNGVDIITGTPSFFPNNCIACAEFSLWPQQG